MLRTDSPTAPTSLMFSSCLWHRWPHNHCWAHQGRRLDFQSLLLRWFAVHPWDWSQWFICGNMCPPPPTRFGWWLPAGLESPPQLRLRAGGKDGAMAIENHQKVACGPLVIKAARGSKSNDGRGERGETKGATELQMSSKLSFYCFHPNPKYLKMETRSVLKMNR